MTTLQPFQQRVVEEREDLRERTEKLLAFIDSPAFAKVGRSEQHRMRLQASSMTEYGNVLADRIAHFTSPDDELVVFNKQLPPSATDPMAEHSTRVAMDVRQLAQHGIPKLQPGQTQRLQHVFRRDFEAGEQFKDVVLL